MSRIHLVKISSKIYEDTYNEGFVSFTGCGLRNEPIGKSFDSIDSALKHLHDHYGLPVGKENYDIDDVNKNPFQSENEFQIAIGI